MYNTIKLYFIIILFSTLITNTGLATAQIKQTHLYTAARVLSFTRMGQAIASPNGKQIVFITLRVRPTPMGERWQSSLYLQDKIGKIHLLAHSWTAISSPEWSANGQQITFLAAGRKFQSIWDYNLQTHVKHKLFEFNGNISAFQWSPNEKYIAFVAAAQSANNNLINIGKASANSRLFLIDMQHLPSTAHALTPASISITQISDNGLIDKGFTWAPNNQNIAFAYQSQAGANYANQSKIAVLDLHTARITPLPFNQRQIVNQPIYSPNGKWLAFRASSINPKLLSNNPFAYSHICISNSHSLKTHCLENTPNQAPTILGWDQQNTGIFVLDSDKVFGPQLYLLHLNPRIPVQIISQQRGYIDSGTISLNRHHDKIAFSYETASTAPHIVTTSTQTFKPIAINFPTNLKKVIFGHTHVISWRSSDGKVIQGLLITPKHYDPKKRYPLLVIAHGGPANASVIRYLGGCEEYGESIVPHCAANLLSLGFIIFQPNPRGSDGYGKTFRFANIGDLGGGDYHDIITGINALIQRGIADPNHLAIFGWSYGGYMTAWTITQTHRFKAAIDGDGLTDLISFTGTTDIPWYLPQYLGSTFWHDPSLYLQRSPIMRAKNIKTPLLILHGENDTRVPLSQANELYTALRLQHKKVTLLVAPGQHHVPTNANITLEQIKAIDSWLQQALK